ncbi:MAG TPA: hypothetical protein PKC69_11030 [Chitinophagaceae bacterium]|nr:hypothetical protein [Chitinophagaceae bacterium]
MSYKLLIRLGFLPLLVLSLFSCSDKTEEFQTEPLEDYTITLEPGKYITYRVDSTIATNFGLDIEVRSWQIKHQVDALITDNLDRPSYRILKFRRNADGTGNWEANGTYMVTVLPDRVESIEDNLRIMKLHAPIREGYTWKGNKYLHLDPYASFGYSFSLYDYMNWDFYYQAPEASFSYEGETYEDVYTVEQEDFSENFPVVIPEAPGSKYRAREKFAKNTGMVFREYFLMEYEPNTSGPNPYYTGFGVTMWMIDHN